MESKKKHSPTYTAEFRERGVRLYREHRPDCTSDNAAYRAIAAKLGCSHDTLRAWCLQAARDAVRRHGKLALWRHEELAPSISQEGILDDHFDE